ncbi:MAG TPA: L,D-transpeptidase family protein [Thermoanaerobaculia bacterium]|jgi:murein L,D-transpeptidase YcbB/YkuD
MRSIIVALLLAASFAVPIAAQDAGPATIRTLVTAGHDDDLRWPDFSDYRKHLVNFYEPLNYAFAWSRNGKVTPQALAAIALFESADVKGINAVDYDGSRWGARLQTLSTGHPDDVALARFDVAVTASLMRYISDLHIGRINPRNLRFELDIESKKYYLPKLLTQIKDAPDPAVMLSQIEPPYEEYRRLQRTLSTYRQLAADAAHETPLPDDKTIKPGEAYAAAPQLARMLRRVGDLPATTNIDPKRLVYDGALLTAVKRFQSRHGLQPDGVISAKTFRALNTPLSFRVKQIQWALERWRWAPMEFDTPPVIVNIPEFVLRAWNEKGETQLAMRVVVGKAYSHQTPVFAATMQYVVLRPYWGVPASIQAKELIPKIAASPGYLARNGYELVTPDGEAVDTDHVDSDTLAKLRSFALQVRQKPGANNALGLIKFIFPNQNNVYFHSTPSQELFSKTRRDFSHGCIRLEDPVALAQWVLRDQPQWTAEEIRKHMKDGDPTQINLPKPIPIMIIYSTASVGENGEVHFFEDIYGHDETLENALAAGYPYPA